MKEKNPQTQTEIIARRNDKSSEKIRIPKVSAYYSIIIIDLLYILNMIHTQK